MKRSRQERSVSLFEETGTPPAGYVQKGKENVFSGGTVLKGTIFETDRSGSGPPALLYRHPRGEIWIGDAIVWLRTLDSESVDLVFADPPYNLGKARWDVFRSQKHYVEWSGQWIQEAARVLKPGGTLYICGFSEILADLKVCASHLFSGCRWLVWHYRNKANLRSDWGRSHESILHFRKSRQFTFNTDAVRTPYGNHTLKYPEHPGGATSQYRKGNGRKAVLWQPDPRGAKPRDVIEIPTTCNGMHEKTPHPTQKPEELLRRLILASSNVGDLVIDPFTGSGTTVVAAEQLGRRWKGCDISSEYVRWAVRRIELVQDWPIEKWIQYDFENARRRKLIR